MRLSLDLGLGSIATMGGWGGLQSLFANGENGFLFDDMSDLTRLFTTSVGPTAVAANDDPVGLMLDRSKWGVQTLAHVVAGQSQLVSNGDFANGLTSWVFAGTVNAASVSGGVLQLPNGESRVQGVTVAVGTTYEVYCEGTAKVYLGTSGNGSQYAAPMLGASAGVQRRYITATTTTLYISAQSDTAEVLTLDNVSVREVPGNHALQATSTQRALWKANSGKPYLNFDGSDDRLISPFIPTTAVTLACAVRFPATDATSRIVMGGGNSTGNKRCFIGKTATTGQLAIGWGAETIGTNAFGPDLGATDHVILVTGDAATRDVWLDGALVDSRSPAGTGPDGTGGGVALGAYNNNGTPSTPFADRLYSSLAINRRVTAAEVANITNRHRNAFP